jgi:hypothetical protein
MITVTGLSGAWAGKWVKNSWRPFWVKVTSALLANSFADRTLVVTPPIVTVSPGQK